MSYILSKGRTGRFRDSTGLARFNVYGEVGSFYNYVRDKVEDLNCTSGSSLLFMKAPSADQAPDVVKAFYIGRVENVYTNV